MNIVEIDIERPLPVLSKWAREIKVYPWMIATNVIL
jgi:hypothetical protein